VIPASVRHAAGRLRRALERVVRVVEVAQVRWLGASAISLVARTPVLVLHTTGRRTGAERASALAFHEEGDGSFLVVGGAGGQARTPDWVANLRAAPGDAASVTVHRTRVAVRVEELAGDERRVAWVRLAAVWPRIERYERRAGRAVPVFRLVPIRP
jgi:deazaflavin-dependent oxidoreductase (nitroreductase family)